MKALALLFIFSFGQFAFAQDYHRPDWRHWIDVDQDCQDARQEVLVAHSVRPVTLEPDGCRVATGLWILPYTQTLTADIGVIHIDHVIALEYAHSAGGAGWPPLLKKLFANDPDNLLAVRDVANWAKGSRGPAEFMPQFGQCEYATRWRMLSRKYELALKAEDLDVIRAAIAGLC